MQIVGGEYLLYAKSLNPYSTGNEVVGSYTKIISFTGPTVS